MSNLKKNLEKLANTNNTINIMESDNTSSGPHELDKVATIITRGTYEISNINDVEKVIKDILNDTIIGYLDANDTIFDDTTATQDILDRIGFNFDADELKSELDDFIRLGEKKDEDEDEI